MAHRWHQEFHGSLFVDVDNDGCPDLVLGRWQGGVITSEGLVLLNDGHGDFTRRAPVTLPAGAFGSNNVVLKMATIDANGDGNPDLLLAVTGSYVGGQIQLLINRGDGTFVDETLARLGPRATVATGYNWDSVVVADINGDGKPDILARSGWPSERAPTDFAWINDGNGVFAPVAVATLTPRLRGRIVLTDVNGDGNLDLVWVEYLFDTGELSYQTYLNTGARTVPGEPIIGRAVPGNATATISFKPPWGVGHPPSRAIRRPVALAVGWCR